MLQRDLGRFLVDLSIALHRHAMYPAAHPSLLPVLDRLAQRADVLLQERPRLAVGVARNQLVIEGVATDGRHPLLRGLAERLHRHYLAVLELNRGLTTDELFDLIATLAADPDRGDGPLGTRQPSTQRSWPHVRLHPVTIEGLSIVADAGGEVDGGGARCAQLWIGLANAALDRTREEESASDLLGEPAVVARAIDEHQRVETYDQVVVGYLLQIAEELRTAEGADAIELRRRTAQLVGALDPDTLKRLLEMGGDSLQRRRFVSDVATGMAASAVVDVVEAAAAASQETVSTGLLRMLSKLASHAEVGTDAVRPLADSALREQVQQLIGGWELADPHPEEYRNALERIAHRAPLEAEHEADPDHDAAVAIQIVHTSIELDEDSPALARAVETLVSAGRVRLLVKVVGEAGAASMAERLRERLRSASTVHTLLHLPRPHFEGVGALLPWLDGAALGPLFDLLMASDDRQMRRATFDLLRRAGPIALPLTLARLGDPRWYVVRNLLALIGTLEHVPADFDPYPWLTHFDARVRREALRIALRLPDWRGEAIRLGLGDEDETVLGIAITSAQEGCPPELVPDLLDLASRDALDDGVRASAVRALGAAPPDPQVLEFLLREAGRDARRLPWQSAPPTTATLLAAIAALHTAWSDDGRAMAALAAARTSPDPSVRRAAGGAA